MAVKNYCRWIFLGGVFFQVSALILFFVELGWPLSSTDFRHVIIYIVLFPVAILVLLGYVVKSWIEEVEAEAILNQDKETGNSGY